MIETEETEENTDEQISEEDLRERRYDALMTQAHGEVTLHTDLDNYFEVMTALFDDGFGQVVDLCGVDALELPRADLPVPGERFEVVVHLLNHARRERIRVRVQVADGAEVPTLFDLWAGTEAMEREAFDMFGIVFADHPDMSRILMPEDWNGYPLRKDFDIGRIPVQFKDAPGRA